MVNVSYESSFQKKYKKIKDSASKIKVKKQISKIINNPKVGKPMTYSRKGTREVYITPYRLSYNYIKEKDEIVFLNLYHKDKQ